METDLIGRNFVILSEAKNLIPAELRPFAPLGVTNP
jgi:hypothetical protein